MKYYKHIYFAEGLENKKDKIIKKLDSSKFQVSIHLIVLPRTEKNHLEIMNSILLLQPDYPKEDYFVVGITKSYDGALELVEKITKEVYHETKGTDIRSYILEKEQEE